MTSLAAIRAKSNVRYTCQECGSTELIQAHHETPGDDSTLVVLCADCHSQRHPSVPMGLFFNKTTQPYWHNKSASSLAKEIGVHPRTIIRAAKRLGIRGGELSPWDEELIKSNIPKMQWSMPNVKDHQCPRVKCKQPKRPKRRKHYRTIRQNAQTSATLT